ncbi:SatD family protein [Haploplasma axanthum]|nr:SatD family protein [Haploplasma axanthum]
MNKYIAIICDIKNSKQNLDRYKLQIKLETILDEINSEYDQDIKMRFTITLGDEFQVLLSSTANIFEMIYKIKLKLKDVEIRVGIGIGNLETSIKNTTNSFGTDGPVWWNAREMVESLKKKNEKSLRNQSSIKIKGLNNKNIEDLVNHTFVILNLIETKFTKSQKEIIDKTINLYGFSLDFTQTELAMKINEDIKRVNKILNNAKYYDFINTFKYITKLIEMEMTE